MGKKGEKKEKFIVDNDNKNNEGEGKNEREKEKRKRILIKSATMKSPAAESGVHD